MSEYFSSFLVGGVETQTGPGNTTSFANTAIGGTANILTPAFTKKSEQRIVFGTDQYLAQYANLLASGSVGKLGYVLGAGVGSSNGPYYQTNKCVVIPDSSANNNTPASVGIIDYCGDASGSLFTKGEIAKLRYEFSPVTSFEAGFVGSQGGYLPQGTSYGQSLGVTRIATSKINFTARRSRSCGRSARASSISRTTSMGPRRSHITTCRRISRSPTRPNGTRRSP